MPSRPCARPCPVRARAAVASALRTTLLALALTTAVMRTVPGMLPLWGALLGAFLCSLCWALGATALSVIHSERLVLVRGAEPDPNAPLLGALLCPNAIIQDLALQVRRLQPPQALLRNKHCDPPLSTSAK